MSRPSNRPRIGSAIGVFDAQLVREFFQVFAGNAGMTPYVETLYGEKPPHGGIVLQGHGAGDRFGRRQRVVWRLILLQTILFS